MSLSFSFTMFTGFLKWSRKKLFLAFIAFILTVYERVRQKIIGLEGTGAGIGPQARTQTRVARINQQKRIFALCTLKYGYIPSNLVFYNINELVFDATASLTMSRARVTFRRIAQRHNIATWCMTVQGSKLLTLWDVAHFYRSSHEIGVLLYHN